MIESREAEILGASTWPGIPGTIPTNESEQSQIDHSRSKKDDLIHHALQDILETKEVSNDVCQELQVQSGSSCLSCGRYTNIYWFITTFARHAQDSQ